MHSLVFDVTYMFVLFYEYGYDVGVSDTHVRSPIQGTSIPSLVCGIQQILMMSGPSNPLPSLDRPLASNL